MTEEAFKHFVEEEKWSGLEPVLGRNILSMFITGLLNIFAYPSWVSIIDFFLNLFFFFFWAFIGGFVGASTFIAFEADKLTYHHAHLSEFDLYRSTMVLIKDAFYTLMGEPHFFMLLRDVYVFKFIGFMCHVSVVCLYWREK